MCGATCLVLSVDRVSATLSNDMKSLAVAGLGPIPDTPRLKVIDVGSSLLDIAANLPAMQKADLTVLCDLEGTHFDLPPRACDIVELLARLQLGPWCDARAAKRTVGIRLPKGLSSEEFALEWILSSRALEHSRDLSGHSTKGLEPFIGRKRAARIDLIAECAKLFSNFFSGEAGRKPRALLMILGRQRSALGKAIVDAAIHGGFWPRLGVMPSLVPQFSRVVSDPVVDWPLWFADKLSMLGRHDFPVIKWPPRPHAPLVEAVGDDGRIAPIKNLSRRVVGFGGTSGSLEFALLDTRASAFSEEKIRALLLEELWGGPVKSPQRTKPTKRVVAPSATSSALPFSTINKITESAASVAHVTMAQRQKSSDKGMPSTEPFFRDIRPDVNGFDWKDMTVAYNQETQQIGFVYGGKTSKPIYLKELPGMGSRKSKGEFTQHGKLLATILTKGKSAFNHEFVMQTASCPRNSIRQILLNLNTALIALFFSSTDSKNVPPLVKFNRKAKLYRVGFTIRLRGAMGEASEIEEMMDALADKDGV